MRPRREDDGVRPLPVMAFPDEQQCGKRHDCRRAENDTRASVGRGNLSQELARLSRLSGTIDRTPALASSPLFGLLILPLPTGSHFSSSRAKRVSPKDNIHSYYQWEFESFCCGSGFFYQ